MIYKVMYICVYICFIYLGSMGTMLAASLAFGGAAHCGSASSTHTHAHTRHALNAQTHTKPYMWPTRISYVCKTFQ